MLKRVFKIIGIVVGAVVLLALIYVLYVILSYSRIPDMETLEPAGKGLTQYAELDKEYTVVTQN